MFCLYGILHKCIVEPSILSKYPNLHICVISWVYKLYISGDCLCHIHIGIDGSSLPYLSSVSWTNLLFYCELLQISECSRFFSCRSHPEWFLPSQSCRIGNAMDYCFAPFFLGLLFYVIINKLSFTIIKYIKYLIINLPFWE